MKKKKNELILYSLRTGTIGPPGGIDEIPIPSEFLLVVLPTQPPAQDALLPDAFGQDGGRRLLPRHGVYVLNGHLNRNKNTIVNSYKRNQ